MYCLRHNRLLCALLSAAVLWFAAAFDLPAQTTEGREFWLVFQKNFRDSVADEMTDERYPAEPLRLHITITARKDARGYIECPDLGVHESFEVKGGEVITITVNPALQVTSSGVVEKKVLHVVSDVPVSVYAGSHRYQTTDTYLAFPLDALGLAYRAVGYKWLADDLLSQFAVAATEDNTTVTITPSISTQKGNPGGVPLNVVLNRGEVYQVIPRFNPTREGDLTGSLITADKPVAVFSGHNCAYVPDRTWKACNLLVEQLPPVGAWGKEFVVGTFSGRSSSVIRVVAHQDGTDVWVGGVKVATLNGGQFYENPMVTASTVVKAGKPVLLTQYAKGYSSPTPGAEGADSLGDPMMIVLPPVDQYLKSYSFATPYSGSWNHYITVTATTEGRAHIRLDGAKIPIGQFTAISGTNYHVAQVKVEEGAHRLEGESGFGLYSYGFGYGDKIFDAYGNNCGQGLTRWMAEPPRTPAISQTPQKKEETKAAAALNEEASTPRTTAPSPTIEILPPAAVMPSVKEPADATKNTPKIESRESGR